MIIKKIAKRVLKGINFSLPIQLNAKKYMIPYNRG